jgi:hypothetical protein
MTHTDIRGFTFFAVCAGILLAGATAPAWTEQDAAADEGLSDMVVEAENQVLQDIRKTTFEVSVSAAVIDTFYSDPDQDILVISPVEGLMPFFNNPEDLRSDQIPHCWLQDPARVPVVTFYPEDPEGHKARRWTLTVTDFRGAPFRHFDGKGKPPSNVEWDGRGDRAEMLQVGYPYSYIFQVVDKGTNTYNYAGVGFRIPAMDFREGTQRRLEFTGNEVFREGRSQLVDSGRGWLIRAADEIRRDHPYSPLRVVVQAENKRLAQDRAKEVAAFLTENLMMADDWIRVEAEARPDLRAEMDGSVSIRVEYAEEG